MPDNVIIIEDKPEEKPVEAIEKIAEEIEETPVVSSTEAVDLALRQQEDREEAQEQAEALHSDITWTSDMVSTSLGLQMDINNKLDTLINLLTPKEDEIMPEEEKPIVIEEEKKPEEKPTEEKPTEEKPVESSEKKKKRFWI